MALPTVSNKHKRIKPIFQNTPIVIVGVFFSFAFISGFYWLNQISHTPPVPARDYILLFSVYIAGMGWVIGIYYSTKNQRKQHTINVLLSHTKDSIYHQYAKTFNQQYPPFENKILELDEILKNDELRESIRYLLNEYEFIAAAIKRKDLDYCLMKDTIRRQLCTLYRKCEPYIKHVRGEKKNAHTEGAQFPRVYEHLMDLYNDWSQEDVHK